MKFTVFPDRFGQKVYPQDATLQDLAEHIPVTVRKQKTDLPLVKLGLFGDRPNEKGCYRTDENLTAVTGIEADYDGEKTSFEEAVAIAERAGLCAIIYTSPSHCPEKPRWRVLAPFSGTLKPADRDRQMGRLAGLYGDIFAVESWTLSQSYFFGRIDGSPAPLVSITPGQTIDLLSGLDERAIAKPNGIGSGNAAAPGAKGPFDEAGLIAAIMTGDNYHRASLSLLGHWASAGVSMVNAKERLEEAFEAVFPPDRDQRWNDRFAEIPRLIAYVFGKGADKLDERVTFTLRSSESPTIVPPSPEPPAADPGPDPDSPEEDTEEADDEAVRGKLPMASWLDREIALSDRLLGHLLTTTSRLLLVAPTGLGKTNLGIGWAFATSTGQTFLHWQGSGASRKVLYIDGEMPARLMRERLEDCSRRNGGMVPQTLFVLSREDFPDMRPLNTPAGRQFVDRVIDLIGGVDVIFFDNIQSLLSGDMKEEIPWRSTLPWIWELTRRKIGQVWIHHTGHDETHSYGTKTREWQLDTVALMEAVERPEADIAFALRFTKARERVPHNRADFDPVVITLADDHWAFEPGRASPRRKQKAEDYAFELLRDALARGEGEIPPASSRIPVSTACIGVELWRTCFRAGFVSDGDPDPTKQEKAANRAFQRVSSKLIGKRVGKYDRWVWIIK